MKKYFTTETCGKTMKQSNVTTVDNSAKGADAAREGFLTRFPMVLFFLLSFVFTWGYFWLIWAPFGLPESLIALGGFGPSVSAFLVLAITSGKPGVLRLLRSIVHWRVGVRWYLVVLLGVPILNLLAFLVVPGTFSDFVAPDLRVVRVYLSEMQSPSLLALLRSGKKLAGVVSRFD